MDVVDLFHQLAYELVHVGHHVREVFSIVAVFYAGEFWVPVRAVRRGLEWFVSEQHRAVEEERAVFVLFDEVEGEGVDEIGAVFAVSEVALLAVIFEAGVGVARWTTRVLPETCFVEAESLWQVFVSAELPFAGDGRG